MGLLGRRWRRLDRGEMVGSRSRVRLYGGASGTPLRVRLPRGMGLRWAVRPVGQALGRGQLGFTGRGCSLARRTLDPLLFRPAGSGWITGTKSGSRIWGTGSSARRKGKNKIRPQNQTKPNQSESTRTILQNNRRLSTARPCSRSETRSPAPNLNPGREPYPSSSSSRRILRRQVQRASTKD